MKASIKRPASKLLNLPDALEANVRAGDLWSLFHALNANTQPVSPASVAPVRAAGLRPAMRSR